MHAHKQKKSFLPCITSFSNENLLLHSLPGSKTVQNAVPYYNNAEQFVFMQCTVEQAVGVMYHASTYIIYVYHRVVQLKWWTGRRKVFP